ncbi:MAG: SurA N-terminal domain-containing protein [Pyrinomonadaceae bacterium]|nr:SurA N-terminal domain-containing protein [Pyrinomonadaceae bacterium]
MQNFNKILLAIAVTITLSLTFAACETTPNTGKGGATDTAATVNGKAIKMEEVDKAINQQLQGQANKPSPLELDAARLQIIGTLVQNEVLLQKAEQEKLAPTEDEVTGAINKQKTDSRLTQEEFDKQLKEAGQTEQTFRETIRKSLAVQKLVDKIGGAVKPPNDQEVTDVYNASKEAFVEKRGAEIAAIVIDPSNAGEADKTKNPQEAQQTVIDTIKALQQGADFASIARERSEDQSGQNGGSLGLIPEDALKQEFTQAVSDYVMNKMQVGSFIPQPIPVQGKYYILKLQRRQDKDEQKSVDDPKVRQVITDTLVNARKQNLSSAYISAAMSDAKVENFIAKRIVENPNNSGVRPAADPNASPKPTTTPTPSASPTASPNSNTAVGKSNTATAPTSTVPTSTAPSPTATKR